jgi:hypothetical protein
MGAKPSKRFPLCMLENKSKAVKGKQNIYTSAGRWENYFNIFSKRKK